MGTGKNQMNRRDFLRCSAAAVLGMGVSLALSPLGEAEETKPAPVEKPEIFRPFLQFTDHEERPVTEGIVIHHTAMPMKGSTAEKIHRFHREERGWAGIGYHYFIREDGTIEQGRWPSLVGAHSYHYNNYTVGICLAGNFDEEQPTKAQLASLFQLTAWLCQEYGLDPMKEGRIAGHCNLNDTACPGKNLYSKLAELREYCRDRLQQAKQEATPSKPDTLK